GAAVFGWLRGASRWRNHRRPRPERGARDPGGPAQDEVVPVGAFPRARARTTLRAMSAPFIGRQRELADLVALIRQPTRLRLPVATIVIGEPGRGKTRLLSEGLTSSGLPPVVRVFGFEPNQTVPLAAA